MSDPASGVRGRPSMIYIMGSGRSGSTLLDRLLGSHPDLFSLGELQNAVLIAWRHDALCSCGRKVRACPFWGEFLVEFQRRHGTSPEEWLRVERDVENTLFKLHMRAAHPRADSDLWRRYQALTGGALDLLFELSGRRTLIDSSKTPSRALRLARLPVDLALVHLVRDCRGVAFSERKAFRADPDQGLERAIRGNSVARTSVGWAIRNRHAGVALKRLGHLRSSSIRYEDLAAEPAATLLRLQRDLGLREVAPAQLLEPSGDRQDLHLVAGNRLRMQERIVIKPDDEWRRSMRPRDRVMCSLLAAPGLRRFGYSM